MVAPLDRLHVTIVYSTPTWIRAPFAITISLFFVALSQPSHLELYRTSHTLPQNSCNNVRHHLRKQHVLFARIAVACGAHLLLLR
jgi:hypothetical protein